MDMADRSLGGRRRVVLIQFAITVVAIGSAIVHLLRPGVRVDGVLLALLAMAVIPWLGSVFESLEVPGIGKFTYIQQQLAETKADLAITKGEMSSTRNRVDFAESKGVDGIRSASATQELRDVITRYNKIRATMKSGPQRTQAMTDVVRHMTLLADRLKEFDCTRYLTSQDGGERLAAYAYLYACPNAHAAEPLARTLTRIEDRPFGQYWAIMALGKSLKVAGAQRFDLEEPLREFLGRLPLGSDRFYELSQVLDGLE
jgi:hypothetical protein